MAQTIAIAGPQFPSSAALFEWLKCVVIYLCVQVHASLSPRVWHRHCLNFYMCASSSCIGGIHKFRIYVAVYLFVVYQDTITHWQNSVTLTPTKNCSNTLEPIYDDKDATDLYGTLNDIFGCEQHMPAIRPQ